MKKSKIYLFAAIGFLGVGIANFFTYDTLTVTIILINLGWILISGLYFYQSFNLRKTEETNR